MWKELLIDFDKTLARETKRDREGKKESEREREGSRKSSN